MEINEVMANLSSEDTLARRASAKLLSDLVESDPTKLGDDDIGKVVGVLRETDDTLTLEHLLRAIGSLAEIKLPYLVNTGMLRAATDVFVKNMGGAGLYAGRDAIRLISILAPSDAEGTSKIGVVRLILRALENSTDPCIHWYALMALRKIDPSIIQSEAQEVITYSTKAMAKENDEDTRLLGASALLVVASVAPQALGETGVINTLIVALTKDLSTDVQACTALALQFIAKVAPSRLRATKIGEALFETLAKKLKSAKTTQAREENEILVTVASTIAILSLKDATALGGGKAIEQIDPVEAIFRVIEEGGVEAGLRSILFSTLANLSEKAPQYINSRKMVEALVKILESSKEEDSISKQIVWILRRIASIHPVLFSGADVLEKLARVSLDRATRGEEKGVQSESDPLIIFQTLVESDKGIKAIMKGFSKLYRKSIVIEKLSEVESWKPILRLIEKGEPPKEEEERNVGVPPVAIKEAEPSHAPITEEKAVVERTESREERGQRKVRKERKLTEEQRKLLQEIFRTYTEIPVSELAAKLDVDQDTLRETLQRLIQSGKLALRIERDILYLGKKSPAPAVVEEKEAPPVSKQEEVGTCLWCGARTSLRDEKCAKCGKPLAQCLICNKPIAGPDQVQKCLFCGALFHKEHYNERLQAKKACPKCGISWTKI
nr:PCI domain-containing protein [Candidatus Njordarchaeum guaymaensis]